MKHETLQAERKPTDLNPTTMRKNGLIPCILFGEKEDSIPIVIEEPTLIKNLKTGHKIFQIAFEGTNYLVNIDDVQRHPVTRRALHVAFLRIKMNEKTKVSVPIHVEGSPAGEKEGGILVQPLSEIEIITLPTNVPEYLTLDISDLGLGGNKTIADLIAPSGIEFHPEDMNKVICTCSAPKAEKVEKPAEGTEDEATTEGETPTEEAKTEEKSK